MTISRRLATLPLLLLGLTAIAALVLIPWVVQAQSQTQDENNVVWSADMLVVKYTDISIGAASADLFSNVGGTGGLQIKSLWSHIPGRDLRLSFAEGVAGAEGYTLQVGDLTLEFPKGSSENSSFKWTDVDVDWEDGQTIPVSIVPTSVLVKPTPNSDATGLPTINGTPQVREILTAGTADIADEDGLTNVAYRYQWSAGEADINGATGSTYTLTTSEQGKTIKVKVSFTDDADNEETLTSEATVEVAAAPNHAATGAPTISGTPHVRETLTADTVDIADGDGLNNVSYGYQWIRNDGNADADIEDATDSTYKLSDTDVGKTIKVRVSFTDSAGNDESLTSVATTAVLATVPTQPLSLAVATGDQIQELDASWQAPSSNGGSAITGYKVQWKEAADSWDTAADVSEATLTGTTDTITGLTGGVAYAVRVIASNVMGYGPASTEAAGTPSGGISEQNTESENSAPAGLPTISGTPEAEQTLTADTSAITDGDGLTNVSYGYQWIRNDGNADADIEDATDSTYKLSDADVGKTIKVKVSFTDDADNQETLTSAATDEVVAAQASSQGTTLPTVIGPAVVDQTLTVSTSDIADDDGLTNVSYSYQWIRSGTNGDTDIAGQTASTYTLVAADVGNAIKVKVSFDDDVNNQETRTSEATATVVAKPNVIVILVDDLGYNDVSYNGATQIQTTNIDRLASRGVTFTNGYVPYSTCTPSRAGLLTGRYPSRFGLEGNLAYAPFDDNHGLPLEETLFPERLQDEGYRTGIVGKWQLGAARRFNPLNRGFDYFFGFLGGGHSYWHSNTTSPHDHMHLPLIENTGYGEFDGYLTDVLTDRAIDFIEKPTDEPFFLYLAYNAPHTPLQAPQELIDKYSTVEDRDRRIYLAMVDSLDQNIGRMLDALDESSLADNTVIFFLSDNGGRSGKPPDGDHADNNPLRGAKDSFYEGGIHVPFVASWPAMWPEGHTYDPMVISLDIASTVLKLANATSEDPDRPIDGVDLDPFLRGAEEGPPHQALFWRDWRSGGYAVRSGDDKLIKERRSHGKPKPILDTGESPQLFDLENDISESQDLLAEQPKTAQELAALWNAWNADNAIGNLFYGISSYNDNLKAYLQGSYDQRVLTATQLPKYEIDLPLVQPPVADGNATGLPTISGTPQVRETLTADTADIADEDGLSNVAYRYQWSAGGSDINGATGSTYTLTASEQGKTIKVKVSFTDDADNQESLTSVATTAVTRPPPQASEMDGISIHDGMLRVSGGRVQLSDSSVPAADVGSYISSFKVQWKSGSQEYDATRQAVLAPEPVTANVAYYAFMPSHDIAGLTNDVEYTVRVMATNAGGDGSPSQEQTATPGTKSEQLRQYIEDEIVEEHEASHPWLRQTWNYLQNNNIPLNVWNSEEWPKSTYIDNSSGIGARYVRSLNFSEVTVGAAEAEKKETILINLADIYTMTNGVSSSPAPLGIAHIFFRTVDTLSLSGCWDSRLYLDVVVSLVTHDSLAGASDWNRCIARSGDATALAVVRSALSGQTPDWFADTYHDSDGNPDLEQFWVGVQLVDSEVVAYQLRNSFGGYCDADPNWGLRITRSLNRSLASAGFDTLVNPWRDGGCVPSAPISLTASIEEDGTASLSWEAPESNGGVLLSGYKIQWQSVDAEEGTTPQIKQVYFDDYSDEARPTEVSETIDGLTDGVDYTVRVQAYNPNGDGTAAEVTVSEPNAAPTGPPTISGTPQVRETLTADTADIADEDGLTNVAYRYQWSAGGSDINGATSSTYTLTASEQGKTIKVKVTFTDDRDNEETLTSAATVAVAAAANRGATGQPTISGTPQVGQTLTADTANIVDQDGLTNVSYSYQWIAGGTDIGGATGSTHTLTASEQGKTIKVKVTFTDDADNEETLTSIATVAVAAAAAQANNPPTGLPGISGTPQVGETLTADTSPIDDQDGLTNVAYRYQWTAGGSDIDRATGSTYTLTASEQGKTIKVKVSFTDDADNEESLTSETTVAVAAAPVLLTVSLTVAAPATHDGSSEFTFDIEFSEEFGLSYVTLKTHAFNVTGGTVETAQRTDKPSNISWRITIKPQGNGDVTIQLPATTDCNADGAICTADGRMLSNSLSITVSGPGG